MKFLITVDVEAGDGSLDDDSLEIFSESFKETVHDQIFDATVGSVYETMDSDFSYEVTSVKIEDFDE